MDHLEPDTVTGPDPATAGRPTPGGIRRAIATGALALGLLVVGGTAAVMAASPDPSASPAPATTSQPSSDDSTAPQTDGTKPDCPDGAGRGNRGDGQGGGSDDGSSDDGSSAAPSQTPSEAPSTAPSTTPDVSDSDL
ncbi:MAG TPA: hypothetical protein VIH00_09605 [Candidatus Limnocylindrales bacterium]